MTMHVRTVDIIQDFDVIVDFLSRTKNLVSWSSFFECLYKERNNYCKFKTMLGMSITIVNITKYENKTLVTIHSKFCATKNKEKAFITLIPNKNKICVEFNINFPDTFSDDSINNKLVTLQHELKTLKCLLED